MKKQNRRRGKDPAEADVNLADVRQLAAEVRATLRALMAEVRASEGAVPPKTLLTKLSELQAVYLRVLAAEETFAAKTGECHDEMRDFEAIRAEIGRRLDRIRNS